MIITIDDIKKLIASDESRTLELKKTTGELKDGMHSACAFLNTEGGWLIFGVAPKTLKIIGQEVTDKTQQEIAQALAGLEPAVDVRVVYVDVPEYPGNKVIAMHFGASVRILFTAVRITRLKVPQRSCRRICTMIVSAPTSHRYMRGKDWRLMV